MTPTSAVIGPPSAFESAFKDLKAISDRLEPMHVECYCPAGPNRDRPTPHRDPNAGHDDVKGSTWDCGLADERARHDWRLMIGHLRHAEQIATTVLCDALSMERRSVDPYEPTGLLDAQSGVKRIASRLADLRNLYTLHAGTTPTVSNPMEPGSWVSVDSRGVDAKWARELAVQLMGPRGRPNGSCFEHIHQAAFAAQRIVREVGNGQPPPPCTDCRKVGSVGQPRKGGRCDACYQRRYRLKRRQRAATVRTARGAA